MASVSSGIAFAQRGPYAAWPIVPGADAASASAHAVLVQEDMMQKYLPRLWVLAFAGLLGMAALPAQAAVYVWIAPPAPQAEVVGPPPGPGHTWTNGYHRW